MKLKMISRAAALVAVLLLIVGCGSTSPSSGGVNTGGSSRLSAAGDELDRAIRETSDYLNRRIAKGTKVVFLNVNSDWPDLSEYILFGLMENAVNDDLFSVVDRQQLDLIRAEQNFQYSGEVSDSSAQEIGQMLGAQIIVSGSVTTIGSIYRIQTRAIAVQTAAVQGQFSQNVSNKNETVAALTERKAPAGSATTRTTTGTQTAQTPTVAPVAPAQQAPARVTPLRWSIKDYKDQWGDSIGNYVEFDGNITGSYSNIWDSNVSARITNFRFSRREGLAFICGRLESFMNYNGDLFIKDQNGDERKFTAAVNGDNGGVRVAFSQALVDYLIKGNPERVLFTSSNQMCQFEFPPRFAEAYNLLQASEKN
jgi:TolB-like protein